MDDDQQIVEIIERAILDGHIDVHNDQELSCYIEDWLNSDEYCENEHLLEVMPAIEEIEKLKIIIREEKKKGRSALFRKYFLNGTLDPTDIFVRDILCKKRKIKEIEKCHECANPTNCIKRNRIQKFNKKAMEDIKKIIKIIGYYKQIKTEGVSYESAKIDTYEKFKISDRTFDKYIAIYNQLPTALKNI